MLRLSSFINLLIFIFILVTYSYITSYYATNGNSIINSKNFFFFLILFSMILIAFNTNKIHILKLPTFYWLIFYFALVLLYFIINNHLEVHEFRKLIFAIFFFLSLLIIMSYDENLVMSKKAILIATILAICFNIYEFFDPFVFYSEESELKKAIGRSAGLYRNPNISGEAIVLGLMLSFSVVSKRFKYLFLFFCFIGILLTFSRTSLLGFFLVLFFFIKEGMVNRSNALLFISIFFLSLVLLFPFIEEILYLFFEGRADNLINRLNFFTGSGVIDHSQNERKEIALAAISLFADNLPFGAGLGVTEHWEYSVSTHNMYLLFMAQFGIIGIFLYPLLILSTAYKALKEKSSIAKPYILYMLLIGFTTHNVLDAYHLLAALSFMSILGFYSKKLNRGVFYDKK